MISSSDKTVVPERHWGRRAPPRILENQRALLLLAAFPSSARSSGAVTQTAPFTRHTGPSLHLFPVLFDPGPRSWRPLCARHSGSRLDAVSVLAQVTCLDRPLGSSRQVALAGWIKEVPFCSPFPASLLLLVIDVGRICSSKLLSTNLSLTFHFCHPEILNNLHIGFVKGRIFGSSLFLFAF